MRTIFLLLMITSFAVAEDAYEEIFLSTPEEMASAHAAKDTLIGGLVSPLSGQLVLQETDLIAKGAQDVVLMRRYLPPYMPCQLVEKPIWEDYAFANYLNQHYRGWVIFPHLRLQMDEHGVVRVTEPSGATLDFATAEERAMLVSPAFGMSNASNETPSGKYDYFNTRIKVQDEKKIVLVYAADGTVRHYTRVYQKSGRGEYLLQKEQLPNGKILRYSYKERYLHSIESLDPQERFVYASIIITPEVNHQHFTTQAGEWATYTYERKTLSIDVKDRHKKIVKQRLLPPTLQDVSSPFYRQEHLEYCPRFLLGEQRGKDRIFRSFHKGYGATKNPLSYRVHQLEFPLREDHDFEVAHEMDYDVPIPGKRGGITTAKQKDGSFVRYHISQDLLLSRVQFYDEKKTLKKEKIYTWGHPSGFFAQKQRNWLFAVETKDGEGKLLVKKSFEYDLFGNPIEETLTGDLTGNQELETFTITRKFSKDGRHLLLQEEVEEGEKVIYEYLLGTNLPVSKITLDQEKICLREFWEYDDCFNLTKKSIDDGSSPFKADLIGVTEKKVIAYLLRQEQPHLHRPKTIEEHYLAGAGEKLLRRTHLQYDDAGNVELETVEDPEGNILYTSAKQYNEQGQVTKEINALGHTAISTYNAKSRLETHTRFSGDLLEEKHYNVRGKLLEDKEIPTKGSVHITSYSLDLYDRLQEKRDFLGNTTLYKDYDSITNKPRQIEQPLRSSQPAITRFSYSSTGDKLSQKDPCGHTTQYRYSSYGAPTQASYPDGTSESWRYDKKGRLKTHIDPEGVEISYTYDIFNRVRTKTLIFENAEIVKETFTYSTFHLSSEEDREGFITLYTYDGPGRKISQTKAGRTTTWDYDSLDRMIVMREENGANTRITKFKRDALGNILKETIKDLEGSNLSKVRYSYDKAGNVSSITRYPKEGPATETYLFDPFSRRIVYEDPLGYRTTTTYTEEPHPYVITQDPKGIKTKDTYDERNNLILKEVFHTNDDMLSREENTFDLCSQLIEHKEKIYCEGAFQRMETFRTTYTPREMIKTFTLAADTDLARTTTYSYTPSGLIHTKTLPDGTILTYAYTSLRQLRHLTSSDGAIDHTFAYNKQCILTYAADHVQGLTLERTSDPFGNILEERFSTGLILQKEYDNFDRPLVLRLPDGSQITYSYDPLFLRSVHRHGANGSYTHDYLHYDLARNLLLESMMQDLGYIHHATDLMDRRTHKSSSYFQQTCTYDEKGDLLTSNKNGRMADYTHNGLSQLIEEPGFTYKADSLHNLVQKNETVASVNALNQLEALGEIECAYNLNGDLIEKKGQKHTFYDFNCLHQLTSATQESTRVEFFHDPLGRILKRTLFTLTIEGWKEVDTDLYLHDGKEEIGAYRPDGIAKNLRILGLNKEPIAIELEGRPFACITDLHRNVEQLIDPAISTVANSYRHTSFGEELFVDEALFNPWRYAGKRYDPDLQLINFGKRFYDPELIRWLSHDPAGFIDSYNLYQFIFNNPFRYYDPDGTHAAALSIPIWGAGTAAYIAAVGGPAGWVIGGVIAAILIWKAPDIFETINRQSSAHRVNSEVQGNVTAASDQDSSSAPEDPDDKKKEKKVGDPKRLKPDENATGPHTVFRRHGKTGTVIKHETYQPQTNPRDPKIWESVKRYDGPGGGKEHWNKVLGKDIYVPHVHDPYYPGGIRPAMAWEIPKQ